MQRTFCFYYSVSFPRTQNNDGNFQKYFEDITDFTENKQLIPKFPGKGFHELWKDGKK